MSLDEEIAAARAERARLVALADAGDPIAKLAVRRLDDAERELLNAAADLLFGPQSGSDGLSLLCGDDVRSAG